MNVPYALALLSVLILIAFGATQSAMLTIILAWAIPYAAFGVFFIGFLYRIFVWARSPVPFRIPTTCGQEKSLPWIKPSTLESPANSSGVIARMALEILLFRSLFRNTRTDWHENRPVYGSAKWLWFFGLLFHWSLLLIVLRHLRFFIEPIAPWISAFSALDGFFEIGIPTLYLSDAAILTGLELALHWTLLDAGKTLTGLNGQLDGVRYKGLIDHCKSQDKCLRCECP